MPHFPVLAKLSQILERKVEKVRDEERNKRQDLNVLATSYCGQLKARSSQMIRESDFHLVSDKDKVSKAPSEPTGNETTNIEKVTNGVVTKEVNNGDSKSDKDSKEKRPSNQNQ